MGLLASFRRTTESQPVFLVSSAPKWWQGHSPLPVAIIVVVAFISATPYIMGYLIEPRGLHFTFALIYAEDMAQHESWASEMSAHLGYQNLLTPEDTPRGWFISPLDLFFGLVQRATGIPYMVLPVGLGVLCAPALAFSLMHLARRAGLGSPGVAAVAALLAGSFGPLVAGAAKLGLIHRNVEWLVLVAGEATPVFDGAYTYLLIAILVLINIPVQDPQDAARGFRHASVGLFGIALIYPYLVPILLLTGVLCAALWAKDRGWKSMLKGIVWLVICSGLPMTYWALLPRIDVEYARISAANYAPLFSIPFVFVKSWPEYRSDCWNTPAASGERLPADARLLHGRVCPGALLSRPALAPTSFPIYSRTSHRGFRGMVADFPAAPSLAPLDCDQQPVHRRYD